MIVSQNIAISLERIVRDALHCKERAYGGLVSADLFRKYPMMAAAICIYALWTEEKEEYIDAFLCDWTCTSGEKSDSDFANDLSNLVHHLTH